MSGNLIRREYRNNTPEQIHEYLTEAEDVLRIQGYDPKTHERLLCQVLALVAGKSVTMEQAQHVPIDLGALRSGPRGL